MLIRREHIFMSGKPTTKTAASMTNISRLGLLSSAGGNIIPGVVFLRDSSKMQAAVNGLIHRAWLKIMQSIVRNLCSIQAKKLYMEYIIP